MVVLVFEIKGKLAHFRRPDTTVTHATYPFISRTALLGMLGACASMTSSSRGETSRSDVMGAASEMQARHGQLLPLSVPAPISLGSQASSP